VFIKSVFEIADKNDRDILLRPEDHWISHKKIHDMAQ